jgi:hypothetical protein
MKFPIIAIAAACAEMGSVKLTGGVSDMIFEESGETVGFIDYSPLVALGPPAQSYNGVKIGAVKWGTSSTATLELLWLDHAGDPYGHGTHSGGLLHWDGAGAVFDGWLNVTTDVIVGGNITADTLDVTSDASIGGTLTLAGNPMSFGASDSGGTGYRVVRVPN